MFAKIVLSTLVAACGVASTSATTVQPPLPETTSPPSDKEDLDPGEDEEPLEPEGQHFCCETLDSNSPSGHNCVPISHLQTVACKLILYCSGTYSSKEGHVTCYD